MMSKLDLYQSYLSWLGHKGSVSLQHLFDFPLTTKEDYEDDSKVVNHIIYFVPDLSGSVPRGFFFLEENVFTKDDLGELVFRHSTYHIFHR